MSGTQRLPWARVALEGTTIVVSILLAFGIDALWARRQAGLEEQATLRGLRDDFRASHAALSFAIGSIEGHRARFSRFQAGALGSGFAEIPDSVALLISSLVLSITFDASSGTLEALVSDGRLDDLSDPELRAFLGSWRTRLVDLEENNGDIRAEALRVSHAMETHGGPFYTSIMTEADLSVLRRADARALAAIRADEQLMGYARSLHTAHAFYLRELRALGPILDGILSRIDDGIRGARGGAF